MQDNPRIPDALVATCLAKNYGLRVEHMEYLPIGHDLSLSRSNDYVDDLTSDNIRFSLTIQALYPSTIWSDRPRVKCSSSVVNVL
jgi:hypothetical protein